MDDANDTAVKDPKKKRSSKKSKIPRVRHLGRPEAKRPSFRGIMWPRDELRLDGLVAQFLDTQ